MEAKLLSSTCFLNCCCNSLTSCKPASVAGGGNPPAAALRTWAGKLKPGVASFACAFRLRLSLAPKNKKK